MSSELGSALGSARAQGGAGAAGLGENTSGLAAGLTDSAQGGATSALTTATSALTTASSALTTASSARALASFFPLEPKQGNEARLNSQIETLVASPKTKKPSYLPSLFFFCPDCLVLDSLSRKGEFLLCRACLGVWELRGTDIVDPAQNTADPAQNAKEEKKVLFPALYQTTAAAATTAAASPKSTATLSDVFEWQLRFLASFIKERDSRADQTTPSADQSSSQKKCIFYDSDIALRMIHAKTKCVRNQHVLCMLHSDALYFQEEHQPKQPHDISHDASTILPIRDIRAVHILHYHTLLIQTLDGTQLYLNKRKPESSLLKYFFALLSLLKK